VAENYIINQLIMHFCLVVMDTIGIEKSRTQRILSFLKRGQGWVPLHPKKESKGVTNKTWRIIDNAGCS